VFICCVFDISGLIRKDNIMAEQEQGYLVDIHSHILPSVDDGSKDIDTTLQMIKIAKEEGITHMFATPHYKHGRKNVSPENATRLLEDISDLAKSNGISISFYQGNEIFYFSEAGDDLDDHIIATMNQSDYVLVEFLPTESYSYIRNAFNNLLGLGYRPIIAHIERYDCMVRNKAYVNELYDMGVKIQVNADSLMGKYGFKIKMFARGLLKNEMIDYLGTDAHSAGSRSPRMGECRDFIYKKCSKEYAEAILYKNAFHDFAMN